MTRLCVARARRSSSGDPAAGDPAPARDGRKGARTAAFRRRAALPSSRRLPPPNLASGIRRQTFPRGIRRCCVSRRRDDSGLGHHRRGARLCEPAVRGGEPRRPLAAAPAQPRPPRRPALHLRPLAGGLLHLLDLLRLGGAGDDPGLRLPRHLCRPDAGLRAGGPVPHPGHPPRKIPEHHLHRRLHRRPLRQEPGGGGAGGAGRHRRHAALHRAAAQSGVRLAAGDARRFRGHRPQPAGAGRPRADDRHRHGGVRGAVRHPPHRRHRAPGRADAGDRHRVDRQAGGVPRGRAVRHLRHVRRPVRPHRTGPRKSGAAGADLRHHAVELDHHDGAVLARHPAAAAPVPRRGGGEHLGAGGAHGGVAVPALSRAHQPVRRAHRHCRAGDVPPPASSRATCMCWRCRSRPAPRRWRCWPLSAASPPPPPWSSSRRWRWR